MAANGATESQRKPPAPVGVDDGHPPPKYAPTDAVDRVEDQICFLRTLRAFKEYQNQASHAVEVRKRDFEALSPRHKQLLGFEPQDRIFTPLLQCVRENQQFLNRIVASSTDLFHNYWPQGACQDVRDEVPSHIEYDKVFSTLRQFVRDWSDEGLQEREVVMRPIREQLLKLFPNVSIRADVRVLVPGSGLSRVLLDIALMGFFAQGNEFSYHMLIAGHFMLNHVTQSGQFTIYPFSDTALNNFTRQDQLRPITIPSRACIELVEEAEAAGIPFGNLSMVAGDFLEVYAKPDQIAAWDVIVTVFFIDTAHNIVQYLETMFNALAPGGLWLNVGPLMWHFASELNSQSIELSLDEVLAVARNVGFVIDDASVVVIDTTYANNVRSMKQMIYRAVFFAARKPNTQ